MRASEKAKAVCAKYWKLDSKGYPAKTCCVGCPIYEPCNSPALGDWDAKMDRVNRAAEEVNV